jgi:hypothetical protein
MLAERSPIDSSDGNSSAVLRQSVDGVLVLRPQGALDAECVETVIDLMAESEMPAIVDLDDCIVVDPAVADRIGARRTRDGLHAVCAVCRRLSARRLLARSGALRDLAVFRSVEDALAARVLARHGFGDGWSRS